MKDCPGKCDYCGHDSCCDKELAELRASAVRMEELLNRFLKVIDMCRDRDIPFTAGFIDDVKSALSTSPTPEMKKTTEEIAKQVLDKFEGTPFKWSEMDSKSCFNAIKAALDAERQKVEDAEKTIKLYQAINSKPMTEIEAEKIIADQRQQITLLQTVIAEQRKAIIPVVDEAFNKGRFGRSG